jgi:hypothetical protein
LLVAFVSLRVFTLDLLGDHHPSEKYLRCITKVSDRAPHLEFFTIEDGAEYTFRYKRVSANWVVCDEDEYPAS